MINASLVYINAIDDGGTQVTLALACKAGLLSPDWESLFLLLGFGVFIDFKSALNFTALFLFSAYVLIFRASILAAFFKDA